MYFSTNNKNVTIATTKTDIKYIFLQNTISHFMRFTVLTADSIKYVLLGCNTAQFGRQAPNTGKICCIHLYSRRTKMGGCRFLQNVGTYVPNLTA